MDRDREAQLAAQAERGMRLKRLTEYPEWQELVDTLTKRKDRQATSLTSRILSPGGGGVTEDEIQRLSAFWGGVDAVLETPEAVHKRLETMLRKAQLAQLDEGE